jgi:hypothetical protein
MTDRELFVKIMHYEKVDRMPILHWGGWPETKVEWLRQGMPVDANECKFLNVTRSHMLMGTSVGLYPGFAEQVIEETTEYKIIRQSDGVIAQHWKTKSCIPHFIDFTIKGTDGTGWDEYKKRLQPDPRRINLFGSPAEEAVVAKNATCPVAVNTGSLMGCLRDWMGVENLAYMCYDNLDLLKEMCNTLTDLIVWGLDQFLPTVKVDLGWGWEDICFRSGPLIYPDIFKEVVAPNHQRIANTLRTHGVDLYLVDCDGLVDALLPHWLDSGVNIMFPLEIGAWKADPADYRKRFGKNLRFYGGIDKLEIAKGRAAIDAEIQKQLPLMREGGFVPLPDHLIVPGTTLADYQYYLEQMRKIRI